MANQLQSMTCQRCGAGYVLTPAYLDMLARRGTRVVVPVQCPTCYVTKGPSPKEQGTIKWFSPHKHYGFIVTRQGDEVFFHEQQIVDDNGTTPHKGQSVEFHTRLAVKGPEALNVYLIPDRH
jgi:CspA family cold shock protein